jgi:hypothetical protein
MLWNSWQNLRSVTFRIFTSQTSIRLHPRSVWIVGSSRRYCSRFG